MKFIKSTWSGFEIDSSEYSASFALENPYEGLKVLFSSRERTHIRCEEIVTSFERAIEMAKLENPLIIEEIEVGKRKLIAIYNKFKGTTDNLLSKSDILEIVKAVEILLSNFPHLAYEFYRSIVYVNGFPHSIVGAAFTFTYAIQDGLSIFKSPHGDIYKSY